MTNLDSILKIRDITLPTKVCLVKAMVFPVVRYGCESWAIKKAECWRIDAFELWCWRRLLRVPWTARRSNESILKETSPVCSLEGLMLKLNSNTLATWCEDKLINSWNIFPCQMTLSLCHCSVVVSGLELDMSPKLAWLTWNGGSYYNECWQPGFLPLLFFQIQTRTACIHKGTCLMVKPTMHMAEQIDQKNLGPFELKTLITDYTTLSNHSASELPMFFFII